MRVFFETHGCTANKAETEIMQGLLVQAGHAIAASEKQADVLVLNTCIVKNASENRAVSRIRQLARRFPRKKLVVAGCMPEAEYSLLKKAAPGAALVSTHQINQIVAVVEGRQKEAVGQTRMEKVLLPKLRERATTEIVPISTGCLGACSFCITKLAKGKLFSFPGQKILEQVCKAVSEGCREILLTSQDCGCYGIDRGTNIAELLRRVVEIPGDFRVRVGMMNPNFAEKHLDSLVEVFKNPKMFKFLHVPVQSGSDSVLRAMHRPYKAKVFEKIVEKFRQEIPDICISTDIIVGFPNETDADFEKTLVLMKKTRPDVINISKFYPRPRTEAARMKPLSSQAIKRRSVALHALCKKTSLGQNQKFVGKTLDCLVTESSHQRTGKTKHGQALARAPNYKQVFLDDKCDAVGFVQAQITGAGPNHLKGKLI